MKQIYFSIHLVECDNINYVFLEVINFYDKHLHSVDQSAIT